MAYAEASFRIWVYLGLICDWSIGARPRFDTSTDMGLVLIPADAEVDSVIFRLRATDQDADFPLVFEVTATITPVVRIDNLPCTLYNKVCQANVVLIKHLMPGRLHDFAVRVRDTKGDSNSMQATISATNATTSRDKIFPHIPSLIMVPEDTKSGKELDYLLVRANSWSGKPVYIELWQPKELFTIRQRQTPTQTRGVITLIGELDFEMQSMYTLTIYATDPYTEPGKDTRNIAGLNIIVIVQDVQDVPPIFTLAPPLTRLNISIQTGDIILRVHAEDGDKGVPREITYGLISEGNPFVPFFNISETTGEIVLARPLEELTQITHVGAPVVLSVVAEEIRRFRDEPPAQATVVEVGFLLGEPGNNPPYFENDNYITSIPENLESGVIITFPEQYSTKVLDEDIGKAGVFTLKLENNNGTFEINPTVAERTVDFIIMVRDNTLIDYEVYKSLSFKIIAQEVGPTTNLLASATVTIFIQDVNDNPPIFDEESYEITLSENTTVGTRVIQVHATDKDTGLFGSIRYVDITGQGSEAFAIDSDTGLITVAMGSFLDREMAMQLQLIVQARDENGKGNQGLVPLIVNLLDVNDNAPIFEKDVYEFTLNSDLTNFTTSAVIKATDADAEPPNNEIRYELIHGNYENKFYLNEITGELILRSPITKFRRKKESVYNNPSKNLRKGLLQTKRSLEEIATKAIIYSDITNSSKNISNEVTLKQQIREINKYRRKRAESDNLYALTARVYDLGVPHLASETQIKVIRSTAMEARIMMFVVPGEHPNLMKTVETLATITGGRVTVLDTRPYIADNQTGVTISTASTEGKRTIVVARVEQTEAATPLVDVEKIRNTLTVNGVGIINDIGTSNISMTYSYEATTKLPVGGIIHDGEDNSGIYANKTITTFHEEVTVYKAENKLLFWLLIILGLLMLLAIAALIICCICPGCPFYMTPRKRRVYSSERLVARSYGRPRRHVHRKPMAVINVTSNGKKEAWSADPTHRNWQFNRRNAKNGSLASLPGDVVYISERPIGQTNNVYDSLRTRKVEEQERMYIEDVEERKVRDYDAMDAYSLQRHEMERESDIQHQANRQRYVDAESNSDPTVREQHFYREGNAEVLQLVTRGQVEDNGSSQHQHYPTTFIIDGKDVLLQRFMQDQKARREISVQEPEVAHTVESHHRPKNLYQHHQKIILLPDNLEVRHRRAEELDSNVQKLAMDDTYEMQKIEMESQVRDIHCQEFPMTMPGMPFIADRPAVAKDQSQSPTVQSYMFHDLELARQNALLTRLLLERESRHTGGAVMDSASYLETQSLPGQMAIATQTDKVAATQTERHIRSRSDNDESEEDSRTRKKIKSKKRHSENEPKKIRTLWMKSPIEEEEGSSFDKRLNIWKKKDKDVKEGRKVSLEPGILQEISESLNENGSCSRKKEAKSTKVYEKFVEDSNIGYNILCEENNRPSPLTKVHKEQRERSFNGETCKGTKTSSSPEISVDNGKCVRETTEKKSSRKESRSRRQRTVESVIKPSFTVLEKELTMLTKKLSKLTDKKIQTARDENVGQGKSRTLTKDFEKDANYDIAKKVGASKRQKQLSEKHPIPLKTGLIKTKFKYQQPQVMSTGSSEYDDAFEKSKKMKSGHRQEVGKYEQTARTHRYTKVKKYPQIHVKHKESKKQTLEEDEDVANKKVNKTESKTENTQSLPHIKKLSRVSHIENFSKEPNTSTSSDRVDTEKNSFAIRDSDKKSTASSEIPSNYSDEQKPRDKLDPSSERFSDDFVTEWQRGDTEEQKVVYSITDIETSKQNDTVGTKGIEIIQFSDDFSTGTQTKHMKYPIVSETHEQNLSHDFEKETEDIATFQNLEYMQPKYDTIINIIKKEQTEFTIEQPTNKSNGTISLDFSTLKTEDHSIEEDLLHRSKSGIEKRVAFISGRYEKEIEEPFSEIERRTPAETENVLKKNEQKLEISKDTGKIVSEKVDVSKEPVRSLQISDNESDHTKQEERKEYDDLQLLPAKKLEELKNDNKDYICSSHEIEENKTIVQSRRTGSAEQETLDHKLKKYTADEIPLTETTMNVEERITQEKDKDKSLAGIKSDMSKIVKIMTTEINEHEYITEMKDLSKEHATQEANWEEVDKHTSKIETYEDMIKGKLIDETNQKLLENNLTQFESSNIQDIVKEDTATIKLDSLGEDLPTEITIGGHQIENASHILSGKINDHREIERKESDEGKELVISPAEPIAVIKEDIDREQSQVDHTKLQKLSLHGEGAAESLKVKEMFDDSTGEVFEVLGKESIIKSPTEELLKDLTTDELISSKTDKTNEYDTVIKNVDTANQQDKEEQQVDVSLSLFTSLNDTLELSEESDSSSDISRKTTLTMRPYETPRHQSKSQQGNLESTEVFETNISESEKDTTMEIISDKEMDDNLSLDEVKNVTDLDTIEAVHSKEKENMEISTMSEQISSDNEKVLCLSDTEKANGQSRELSSLDSGLENFIEQGDDIKDSLTIIKDGVHLIQVIKELNDASKDNIKNESITTKEDTEYKDNIVTHYKKVEDIPEAIGQDKNFETTSAPSNAVQIEPMIDNIRSKTIETDKTKITSRGALQDIKIDKTETADIKINRIKIADTEIEEIKHADVGIDKVKIKGSIKGISSTSEKHTVKIESSVNSVRKKQKSEQSKTSSHRVKKGVLDGESKEKIASIHSHYQSHKYDGGLEKERDESRKEPQKKEDLNRQQQSLSKSQFRKNKKLSGIGDKFTTAKTSEIDTSKTQSKYMAWYNKKREETEKKKLERKAKMEDEEQLPRWLSRTLRYTTKREKEKPGIEYKTPEMTPCTRRKIKPLINVESEQLKAIVRQGRQLRKAEGNLKEDPPIQIFAKTPPTSSNTQHRLVQHSEYKYERIPPPFYLHPPPAPYPSPQMSPERFEFQPSTSQYKHSEIEVESDNVASLQSVSRLHQQLLEKKSVFDIAYSEAAPSQLRSDSTTPPS